MINKKENKALKAGFLTFFKIEKLLLHTYVVTVFRNMAHTVLEKIIRNYLSFVINLSLLKNDADLDSAISVKTRRVKIAKNVFIFVTLYTDVQY